MVMSLSSEGLLSETEGYSTIGYDGDDSSYASSIVDIELEAADVLSDWKLVLKPIRDAVIYLLSDQRLVGRRLTLDQLINPLALIGEVNERQDVASITSELIKKAFSCGGRKEYSVQFQEINITGTGVYNDTGNREEDIKNEGIYVIHARMGRRGDDITDFSVCQNTLRAQISTESASGPIPRMNREFMNTINIPNDVKNSLIGYLQQKKKDDDRRNTPGYQKKRSNSSGSDKKKHKMKKQRREEKAAVAAAKAEAEAAEVEAALLKELNQMKEAYDETIEKQRVITEQLHQLRNRIKMKVQQTNMKINLDTPADTTTKDNTLHYIQKGRCGKLDINSAGVILKKDLEDGLLDLPPNIDNLESEKTRSRTNYDVVYGGASGGFVPNTHSISVKNRDKEKLSDRNIVTSIQNLFHGEISTWSPEAKRIMVACSLFGYGCSDEGKLMIMAGMVKALFLQAGIKIDDAQIAKCLPSRATLVEMEAHCAADCLLARCQEMKDDGLEFFGCTSDHGHRGGRKKDDDHLVKILSWAGLDEDGMWTVKFHLVDVDSGGHSAAEAAQAIKLSTELMLEILNEIIDNKVEIIGLTGDSGGGAASHYLIEELIKLGVMPDKPSSKMLACDLHNFVKPLEVACVDTWGGQGIGSKSPFQMVWLFVRMMKMLRGEVGRDGLDTMWGKTILKMRSDPTWMDLASNNFPQAYDMFVTKLNELEDTDLDAALEISSAAPVNIQDPVFSRWGTVLAAISVFVKHWSTIYFFALTIKDDRKSGCHIWQIACALLSLMNNRDEEEPTNDGLSRSLDDFIGSFQTDDDAPPTMKLKAGQTPIFLAVLQFLDGFNKAYFDDMFNFLKKNDPFLGKGTFGQLSRFGPERLYVMHMKLQELEEDCGWRNNPHFDDFKASLAGVSNSGKYGLEYFKKVTEVFFERFRYIFDKWMVKKWRSSSTLHYILAGDAEHAKAFATWLVEYKEGIDAVVEDDRPEYITLGKHHQTREGEPITVNLRSSMEYITSEASRDEILEDPFVTKYWGLIKSLAVSVTTVQLFTKDADGKLDKSTWNGVDYEPLFIAMWKRICIHSNHQQRCENYVQLAGLLSSTQIEEVRKSMKAMIIGSTIRPFNQYKLYKKNEKNAAEGRKAVNRVQGADNISMWLKYADGIFKRSDKAKETLKASGSELTHSKIVKRLKETSKKASAHERETKLEHFSTTLQKTGLSKQVKAEMAVGIEETGYTANAVYLKIFVDTNSRYLDNAKMSDIVEAEILAREIKVSTSGNRKYSKKKLKSLSLAEKRALLRKHEHQGRVGEGEIELKVSEVKYIKPISNEMKAVMKDKQQVILDKQMSIDQIEDSL